MKRWLEKMKRWLENRRRARTVRIWRCNCKPGDRCPLGRTKAISCSLDDFEKFGRQNQDRETKLARRSLEELFRKGSGNES